MTDYISLNSPDFLEFTGGFGARQDWYGQKFQRQAGCGPTTAAHLVWYVFFRRKGTKQEILTLMQDVWRYVKPGYLGVNATAKFARGIELYAAANRLPATTARLPVPIFKYLRPSTDKVADFLTAALSVDLPVAFLNLSKGQLTNLDSWHWVTIVALKGFTAVIYDNGALTEIDLKKWLMTSALGGGFVVIRPKR